MCVCVCVCVWVGGVHEFCLGWVVRRALRRWRCRDERGEPVPRMQGKSLMCSRSSKEAVPGA